MVLICNNCQSTFSRKSSLKYHIEHKICQRHTAVCEHCGCCFSCRERLNYHLTHKVCQSKPKLALKLKSDYKNPETMTRNELYGEVLRLKGQIEALEKHPQHINTNTTNNTIFVIPPSFLEIDTIPVIERICPKLLEDAIKNHPSECVLYLIKNTTCNPEHPIFNSVQLTNKKSNYIKISDGQHYINAPKQRVIAELIENKRSLLQSFVDDHGYKYGEKILQRYQRYVDALDDDIETQHSLEIEIACMLINVSSVIMTDDWSRKLVDELKKYLAEIPKN